MDTVKFGEYIMDSQSPSLRITFLLGAFIFLILLLNGCGMTTKQFMTKINAIRAECDGKLRAGIYRNFYERTQCFNQGLTNLYIENNYRYMDLVFLANAYRLALAERVDKGEITKTEAQVIMAELGQRIAAEEQRRANSAAYAKAASAQGTAALLEGLGALNQSMQPLRRKPITCIQTGDMVNCF